MKKVAEDKLREIACRIIQERDEIDDAWVIYRDEAVARYSAEDDGDPEEYFAEATAIFDQEKMAKYDQAIATADDD